MEQRRPERAPRSPSFASGASRRKTPTTSSAAPNARPARQAGPGCRRGYGVAGIERDEFIRRIAAAILSGRRKSGCTQPIHRTQSPCDVCRGQGYSGPRPRVLTRELGKYHQTTAPRGFEGAARSVNTVSGSTGEPGGDRRKAN
jgi:hypothetical protein